MSDATVQYRLVLGKKDELVEGPDDAAVVLSLPAKDVALDPVVAFMMGTLKASGHTGVLLEVLRSGAARTAFARLSA